MRGMERPPGWAQVLLVALVLGNAALFTYLFTIGTEAMGRNVEPRATERAEPSAAPPIAPPSDVPSPPAPVLAVYGDGYTAGSDLGGAGARSWPALVAEELGMDLRVHAVSMAGYAATGVTGETFAQLVLSNAVPDADVVVIFGSRNDRGAEPELVRQEANNTLAAIRANSPDAVIIAVGPAWSNATLPSDLALLSTAVDRAAAAAGATYVDPLGESWFSEPDEGGLIAVDGVSPTDAGHAYLAGLIEPRVRAALDSAAQATP